MHPSEDYANPDLSMSIRASQESEGTGSIDCRRTFLASFAICIGVSISLRRPAMMRVTTYARECLDYLENSPQAAPGDRMLVAWVRLWVIAEEIASAFSYEDTGDIASIFDTTTQLMTKAFEKRLREWKAYAEKEMVPSLEIMYYTIRLFLYELVLHIDHSPEDFKAPYQMGVIHPVQEMDVPIKPAVEAIADLTQSSHALIDTFVSMGVENARCLPVFYFVRVSFAAFVLAKLCLSAHSQHSRLHSIIDRSTLGVESHVDKLILFVQSMITPKGQQVPSLFLALLFKLRQWCSHPELIQQNQARGAPDIWPPAYEDYKGQVAFLGPRVTEATSGSAEPSPENNDGSGGTSADWNTPAAWSGEHVTANTQSFANPQPAATAASATATASTSQGNSITIPSTPGSDETWKLSYQDYPELFAAPPTSAPTAPQGPSTVTSASTDPALPTTVPIPSWPPADSMDLDGDMLSFLNDMSDLPQDALTGMENWDFVPDDFGLGGSWQGGQDRAPFT